MDLLAPQSRARGPGPVLLEGPDGSRGPGQCAAQGNLRGRSGPTAQQKVHGAPWPSQGQNAVSAAVGGGLDKAVPQAAGPRSAVRSDPARGFRRSGVRQMRCSILAPAGVTLGKFSSCLNLLLCQTGEN